MRAFISIEFPEQVKREIIRIQKEVDRLGLIKGKFTEYENLHLTLKFLGDISESELRAVKENLKDLKFEPFDLELESLGVFSENFIRIIWVGLASKELFSLQKNLDGNLEKIFPKEYRFMAHTTIARPKFVEDRKVFLDEFKKIKPNRAKFRINKISLRESKLSPRGAAYKTLMEVPLVKAEQIAAS